MEKLSLSCLENQKIKAAKLSTLKRVEATAKEKSQLKWAKNFERTLLGRRYTNDLETYHKVQHHELPEKWKVKTQ